MAEIFLKVWDYFFLKGLFFIVFSYECISVGVCTYVQVPMEAEAPDSPRTGVTGNCEPSDISIGTKLRSCASAVSELSC